MTLASLEVAGIPVTPKPKPWSPEVSKQRVALLTKLGRATKWTEALAVVAEHALHGPKLDVFACGACIRACEISAQWEVALALLALGGASRMELNNVAYNIAISVCDKAKKWLQAGMIVRHMQAYHVQTDVITWSALVSAYAKGQQWEEALGALDSMESLQVQPNEMTYSAAISACTAAEPWPWALEIAEAMQQKRLEADAVVQTAMITACGFGGKWEECISIVAGMQGETLRQITCNALMASLQRAAQWTRVLSMLSNIQDDEGRWKNCTLDSFSCAAAIAACGTGGHWQVAVDPFVRSPLNVVLLNVAITACSENFQWQWVLQLLGHSRARGLLPDAISCNSALTACQICGRWLEAETILQEMFRQAGC